jgi:hypothetical protein
LQIDHVLIAVADLASAVREFESRYRLASVEGGSHPGWGPANQIVPLGDAYLELIAVVDKDEAEQSAFGRWVASGAGLLGWAARTDDIDTVAEPLGLKVGGGSRVTADGRLLQWRLAGVDEAMAEPSLPFFIEWGAGSPHPGRAAAAHSAGAVEIAELRLTGNADRLTAWLGPNALPITMHTGVPSVSSLVLASQGGEIVLGTDPS